MTDAVGGQEVVRDAVDLARVEGLEGHARAAECRLVAAAGDQGGSPVKKSKM